MTGQTVASASVLSRPPRRWILTRGAGGAALSAIGAVVAACGGSARRQAAATTWTIGASSVPTRGAVVLGNRTLTPVWVASPAPGRYVALSGVCTHNLCPVQFVAASGQLGCPCHGSSFDAFTGAVIQGPANGPLPRIPLHQRGDQLVVGPFQGPEASD